MTPERVKKKLVRHVRVLKLCFCWEQPHRISNYETLHFSHQSFVIIIIIFTILRRKCVALATQ